MPIQLTGHSAVHPAQSYSPRFDTELRTQLKLRTTPRIATPVESSVEVYLPDSSEAELRELHALRYQTYCLERQFLNPADYPSGLERDSEDHRSAHFAVRDTESVVVGTARLVLSSDGQAFPFEKYCPAAKDFASPDSTCTAEVSRLATSRRCARRKNTPQVVQTIYRQMYRYSREHGIRYWYAAMERPLARMVARYGFEFTAIGPMRDYFGPVTPHVLDLDRLEQKLGASNPGLLRWLHVDS